MVVLSVLRATKVGLGGLQWPIFRGHTVLRTAHITDIVPTCARGMGGHRTMDLLPSKYEWNKWKDNVHYYFALGLIPMGILIFCVNVFIGRAELADIPEGYEPKHWEYYRHPIQRWFSRYVYDPPEKNYEKMLHMVVKIDGKAKLRLLEKKVKRLMAERGDYKGWYYLPVKDQKVYVARANDHEYKLGEGGR